jgi:hypothetical protein
VIALVVAVCFASGTLEALIPDVHDGDAPAALLATGDTADAHDVRPSDLRASGDVRDAAPVAVTASVGSTDHVPTPAAPERDGHQSGPTHPFHVDHCGHAHLAALSAAVDLPRPAPERAERRGTAGLMLVSIALAPSFRPPIA